MHVAVHVGDVVEAARRGRLGDGAGKTRPMLTRHATDRDGAVFAMQRPVHVMVVFKLAEIRQHIRPRPAARARLRPFVVVARKAAQCDHRVDGGSAAHHARLLVIARLRACRRDARIHLQIGPEIIRPVIRRIISVANVPRLLAGGRIASCLDQEHLLGGVFAQPARQHAARRTCTDDDEVVDHARPPCAEPRRHFSGRVPGTMRNASPLANARDTLILPRVAGKGDRAAQQRGGRGVGDEAPPIAARPPPPRFAWSPPPLRFKREGG